MNPRGRPRTAQRPPASPPRPCSRDQQYAASRRLLALAGVKLRQHLFQRPVVLRLSNDTGKPAAMSAVAGAVSSSQCATEGLDAEPAPAVAAALQTGAANGCVADAPAGGTGAADGPSAKAAAAAAAAGQARRRRGWLQGSQTAAQPN